MLLHKSRLNRQIAGSNRQIDVYTQSTIVKIWLTNRQNNRQNVGPRIGKIKIESTKFWFTNRQKLVLIVKMTIESPESNRKLTPQGATVRRYHILVLNASCMLLTNLIMY